MKKADKERIRHALHEPVGKTARKALASRNRDADDAPKNRPEGLLVLKVSEKSQIRAEISDFTGTTEFVLHRWVKTKKAGWVRTKARLGVPEAMGHQLAEAVVEAATELCPRKKKRAEHSK